VSREIKTSFSDALNHEFIFRDALGEGFSARWLFGTGWSETTVQNETVSQCY